MKIKIEKDEKENFYFLLKCMTALAAAAVITMAMIAATTIGSAAATGLAAGATGLAVGATGLTAGAAGAVLLPIIPVVAAIVAIAAVCLLPFLFSSGGNSTMYTTVPNYGNGYWSGRPYGGYSSTFYTNPSYGNNHYHGSGFDTHVVHNSNQHRHSF